MDGAVHGHVSVDWDFGGMGVGCCGGGGTWIIPPRTSSSSDSLCPLLDSRAIGNTTSRFCLFSKSLANDPTRSKAASFCSMRSRSTMWHVVEERTIGEAFRLVGMGPRTPCRSLAAVTGQPGLEKAAPDPWLMPGTMRHVIFTTATCPLNGEKGLVGNADPRCHSRGFQGLHHPLSEGFSSQDGVHISERRPLWWRAVVGWEVQRRWVMDGQGCATPLVLMSFSNAPSFATGLTPMGGVVLSAASDAVTPRCSTSIGLCRDDRA